MQAEAWGFEVRPWVRWRKQNILIAEFKPTAGDLDIVTLGTFLGSRYDYTAAFLVGLVRLVGRTFKGRFRDPQKLMCSEAIVRVLQWANYKAADGLDPETTSPGSLLAHCFEWQHKEFELVHAIPAIRKRHQLTARGA